MKIIFMGTPEFGATILEGLLSTNHTVVAVVTQPDRPKGRKRILTPPPVKEVALKNDIPVYQPEKISGSKESFELRDMEADLIVTAAYGQFVPTYLLESVNKYAINVHASLLPKYRGGAPIHYAIWKGDQVTGISIIEMVKEMDAGDILFQASIPIEKTDDVGNQFRKLAVLGRDSLIEFLPQIEKDSFKRLPQDLEQVSFSPNIPKELEQINWFETAWQIDCHIRAFRPFPTTYTILLGKRIKIWQGQEVQFISHEPCQPGRILAIQDGQIIVSCGQNTYYAISSWQETGKKRVDIKDYLNGVQAEELLGQQFESRKTH